MTNNSKITSEFFDGKIIPESFRDDLKFFFELEEKLQKEIITNSLLLFSKEKIKGELEKWITQFKEDVKEKIKKSFRAIIYIALKGIEKRFNDTLFINELKKIKFKVRLIKHFSKELKVNKKSITEKISQYSTNVITQLPDLEWRIDKKITNYYSKHVNLLAVLKMIFFNSNTEEITFELAEEEINSLISTLSIIKQQIEEVKDFSLIGNEFIDFCGLNSGYPYSLSLKSSIARKIDEVTVQSIEDSLECSNRLLVLNEIDDNSLLSTEINISMRYLKLITLQKLKNLLKVIFVSEKTKDLKSCDNLQRYMEEENDNYLSQLKIIDKIYNDKDDLTKDQLIKIIQKRDLGLKQTTNSALHMTLFEKNNEILEKYLEHGKMSIYDGASSNNQFLKYNFLCCINGKLDEKIHFYELARICEKDVERFTEASKKAFKIFLG